MENQDLYAKIGQLQMALEQREAASMQMLQWFAAVLKGELELSRVMINLTEGKIIVSPEHMRPAMPATINGLPVCVVAPEVPVT